MRNSETLSLMALELPRFPAANRSIQNKDTDPYPDITQSIEPFCKNVGFESQLYCIVVTRLRTVNRSFFEPYETIPR